MAKKKLYRVTKGKKIAGVCAGIAEYYNVDVAKIRLVWILLTLCVGLWLLAYLILALILPRKS